MTYTHETEREEKEKLVKRIKIFKYVMVALKLHAVECSVCQLCGIFRNIFSVDRLVNL